MRTFWVSLLFLMFVTTPLRAEKRNDWVGTGGFGMTMGPVLFLLSTQLEKKMGQDFLVGGLLQGGLGSEKFLSTLSLTARWVFDSDSDFHNTLEIGGGIASSTSFVSTVVGLHLHAGFGVEYAASPTFSLGSFLRLNMAPPAVGFFVSWPMLLARFHF